MVSKGTVAHTNNGNYTTSKLSTNANGNQPEPGFQSTNLNPTSKSNFNGNGNEKDLEYLHYYPAEYHRQNNEYEIHDDAFELNWKR